MIYSLIYCIFNLMLIERVILFPFLFFFYSPISCFAFLLLLSYFPTSIENPTKMNKKINIVVSKSTDKIITLFFNEIRLFSANERVRKMHYSLYSRFFQVDYVPVSNVCVCVNNTGSGSKRKYCRSYWKSHTVETR